MKSRFRKQDRSRLLAILKDTYPEPKSELSFRGEYELVTAVILSAQCTDKKVNQVTPLLFAQYPTFESLSKATISAVEEIIRPINYYRTKAKNIIGMGSAVVASFGGKLPLTREELESLPGVGRKTANVVLSELGALQTIPVDTHVLRVSNRLGLSTGKTPREVEDDLSKLFPPADWRSLHHWLIFHGRRVCKARKPLCSGCALAKICPSADTDIVGGFR